MGIFSYLMSFLVFFDISLLICLIVWISGLLRYISFHFLISDFLCTTIFPSPGYLFITRIPHHSMVAANRYLLHYCDVVDYRHFYLSRFLYFSLASSNYFVVPTKDGHSSGSSRPLYKNSWVFFSSHSHFPEGDKWHRDPISDR